MLLDTISIYEYVKLIRLINLFFDPHNLIMSVLVSLNKFISA